MNDEELKKRYEMLSDCWKFFKRYAIVDLNILADDAIEEVYKICSKYDNAPFILSLMNAAQDELDRVYKEDKAQT